MPLRPLVLFLAILTLAGCAAPSRRPAHPCAGKATVAEAIETLGFLRDRAKPIRAAGQCLLKYQLEGKQHKENFPVKLWINPPADIYLQGDVAFDAAGLVLGSNADEFWFWLKPKEISTYWWGKWTQAGSWNGLAISPVIILESFGAVDLQNGDWTLGRQDNFDVLSLHGEHGDILKRVYVESCDYVVAKIEQFNSGGKMVARAEFADHKQVADRVFVPALIKIIAIAGDGSENSVEISLTSIQPTQLASQQRQRLFVRTVPIGFEHVYQIVDGAAVEQTHK